MNSKVAKCLKILIVNPNTSARSELKNMLANLNQSNVDLMKDGRDLVGREQSFKYDLIFIREDLDHSMTGINLVRYLTRTNLVPKWCKFVIISDNPDAITGVPVFRHLKTEILDFPYNYQMLENCVNATIESLSVFKKILKNLNHISPSFLIKNICKIDAAKFNSTHKDELLELKIKLLLQGRRPDLAWDLTQKINLESDRIREQLFVSFSTGQEHHFLDAIENAENSENFQCGSIYYQTYYGLFRNQPEIALRYFQQLDTDRLRPNEIEAHALLLQKVQGITKAMEFLDSKESGNSEEYDLKNSLSLTKLSCYTLALMTGNLGGMSQQSIHDKMVEIISNNTWSKGSFRYNIYKPFILLGLATMKGKMLQSNFERLYELRLQLDVKQLNMLLFVAHKMGLEKAAIEIHKVLERNAARLEISPELIIHEITHREMMRSSLTKAQQQERYLFLADTHREAGRPYRALRKYYVCHKFFVSDDAHKVKMLELLAELGLNHFWDFTSVQKLKGPSSNATPQHHHMQAQGLRKSAYLISTPYTKNLA